jgi:hypothetical protein
VTSLSSLEERLLESSVTCQHIVEAPGAVLEDQIDPATTHRQTVE